MSAKVAAAAILAPGIVLPLVLDATLEQIAFTMCTADPDTGRMRSTTLPLVRRGMAAGAHAPAPVYALEHLPQDVVDATVWAMLNPGQPARLS